MSFQRIGLDFLGGGMEGAGAGAAVAGGLKMAGFTNPYAVPLIAGFAGMSALQRFMAGREDSRAEKMQLRLGDQQIAMNDLEIETRRRMANDERLAKRKNRALQDLISGIFSNYQSLGKGGTA